MNHVHPQAALWKGEDPPHEFLARSTVEAAPAPEPTESLAAKSVIPTLIEEEDPSIAIRLEFEEMKRNRSECSTTDKL